MVNHRREFDPPLDEVLGEMARRGQLCVKALDGALADGRKFILGDHFTAADIALGKTNLIIVIGNVGATEQYYLEYYL